MESEFDRLKSMLEVTGTPGMAAPKPGEYSGSAASDGATMMDEDPTLTSPAPAPKPPVTVAQRGGKTPVGAPAPQVPALAAGFDVAGEGVLPAVPTPSAARLVFTGVSGSGKSQLAQQLGLKELQLQDDITALYQEYFPGQQPAIDFINSLLVWGEGVVDAKAPVTPARLLFVDFMRQRNPAFGTRGYWQQALLARASAVSGGSVITTCTSQELLTELKQAGFMHIHVTCSNQTLGQRKKRAGANDALASGLNQQIIRELSMRPQGGGLPCVWNDTVPAPSPRLLTFETLRNTIQAEQQSIITGE
jgi:hypothetical protein